MAQQVGERKERGNANSYALYTPTQAGSNGIRQIRLWLTVPLRINGLSNMSPQAQELLEQVLQLSLKDREFIAAHVSESLDQEFEYSPELAAEIQRREAELDAGIEQPVGHDEAMRLMFGKRNG